MGSNRKGNRPGLLRGVGREVTLTVLHRLLPKTDAGGRAFTAIKPGVTSVKRSQI